MSKMSQLHAELSEQAAELGFESIEEAEANGYGIDYKNQKLFIPKPDPKLDEAIEEALQEAHEEWLKERDEVIRDLDHIARGYAEAGFDDHAEKLYKAIEFIKKGEV